MNDSTTAKHTPGPWKASQSGDELCPIWITGNEHPTANGLTRQIVARINFSVPPEQAEANARLIAAGPDLLAALQEIFPYIKDDEGKSIMDCGYRAAIGSVRAAIARATGGGE